MLLRQLRLSYETHYTNFWRCGYVCFTLNLLEDADDLTTASRPGFYSGGAASESAVALGVPVSVWFVPNGNHLASRRRP